MKKDHHKNLLKYFNSIVKTHECQQQTVVFLINFQISLQTHLVFKQSNIYFSFSVTRVSLFSRGEKILASHL